MIVRVCKHLHEKDVRQVQLFTEQFDWAVLEASVAKRRFPMIDGVCKNLENL